MAENPFAPLSDQGKLRLKEYEMWDECNKLALALSTLERPGGVTKVNRPQLPVKPMLAMSFRYSSPPPNTINVHHQPQPPLGKPLKILRINRYGEVFCCRQTHQLLALSQFKPLILK
jgi:hypothetical protein